MLDFLSRYTGAPAQEGHGLDQPGLLRVWEQAARTRELAFKIQRGINY